jgi:hypothetical protein
MQTSPLTTQELDRALTYCVKLVQQTSYSQEIEDLTMGQAVRATSNLKALYSIVDQEGIVRVERRLQQSTIPYHTMHQIILPANHHLTKLIMSVEHIRLHHTRTQLLTASLREKY